MTEESVTLFGNQSCAVKYSLLFYSNHSYFSVIVRILLISIFLRVACPDWHSFKTIQFSIIVSRYKIVSNRLFLRRI